MIDRLRLPSTIMPSDIAQIIQEVRLLKLEIQKIKKALEERGIKID